MSQSKKRNKNEAVQQSENSRQQNVDKMMPEKNHWQNYNNEDVMSQTSDVIMQENDSRHNDSGENLKKQTMDKMVAENKKRQIPKNVRQIGDITGKQKIYVEDYVVTYLNQLAHPTNRVSRGAVLLGEWVTYGKEQVLYISGAVEAHNLSFTMQEVMFSNETWTELHEVVGQYFENVTVVGWFLSRLGYSVKLTDQMQSVHRKYFREPGSVLYLMDALEQEDAFYMSRDNKLVKQTGYYIYYERNTQMQNYLIDHQALQREIMNDRRIEYKDGQLLHSYHEIMTGRKGNKDEKRVRKLLYVTSALLVLVFLALSVSIFNNYDKLQRMQTTLNHILPSTENPTLAIGEGDEAQLEGQNANTAENGPGDTDTEATVGGDNQTAGGAGTNTTANEGGDSSLENADGQAINTSNSTENSANGQATNNSSTEANSTTQEVAAASVKKGNYYTVQAGDTLMTISEKLYHSDAYVNAIRSANEIGENDYIYPGQQILLPEVQ